MAHLRCAKISVPILLLSFCVAVAHGQSPALHTPVRLTVVDENGLAVSGAQIAILEPGRAAARLQTDYAGHCSYILHQNAAYEIRAEKAGFYRSEKDDVDASVSTVRLALTHEQIVTEQVNVTASVPGIDTEQPSDTTIMNTPEIVNIPYPTSRDIRNLLPMNPGIPFFVHGLIRGIGAMFLAGAALGIIAGWGLLERQPWARMLAIVLGFISLLEMPFGTALGIYTLWVLLPAQSEEEYRRMASAA